MNLIKNHRCVCVLAGVFIFQDEEEGELFPFHLFPRCCFKGTSPALPGSK